MIRSLGILVLIVLFLSACEKKKYPPQLGSVSRTQAAIGEEISLSGSQFGDASVYVGSVNAVLKSHTETSISLTVPRMATGPTTIRVQNPDGSSEPLPFTVLQPLPQLTAIDPANGLSGTSVNLSGDFLDKLKTVRFGNIDAQVAAAGTDKRLTVTVPTGLSRGPLKITLETEGGQTQADFIVAATPQITGFSPKRTIVGATLTITGKSLTDGVVLINGVPTDKAKTQVQDDQIKTVIPSGVSSGRLTVSVFEKLTATATDSLIIIPAPQIDAAGLSLVEGIEGDKLTIRGQNLLDASGVFFGGTPGTSLKPINNTTLEVNVPRRSESGEVAVDVVSPGGTTSAAQKFLIILPPTGINTETGRGVRGKELTVSGRNLHRILGATLGGKTATITARTEGTDLTLTVPADASTGKLILNNRAGSGTSSANVLIVLKAVVSDFTRKAATGDRVIIKGDYLQNARVFFAGTTTRAANDGKNEDTELWVKVPADAKDGALRIWNETDEYLDTDVFNVVNSPSITTTATEVGNLEGFAGERVTLTGQNFDDCVVRFLGSAQNAEWVETPTRTRLVVKISADARTGPITVRNTLYTATGPTINVIGKPDITDISPNRVNRGNVLAVKGSNLKRLDDLQIGGQSIVRSAWNENAEGTQVNVTVPDQNLRGQVTAINRAGSDQHRGEAVVVVRPPIVTSVSSMRERVGAQISIKGDYLYGATAYFGNVVATDYPKRTDDAELLVKVPNGANDGSIRVINDVGSVDLPGFSVVRAPVISDFNPKNGLRGSEVTITGQNLGNVTEVRFNNGSDSPTQINSRSDTQLKVRVSDQAQTSTICVLSPAGNDCTNGNYEVFLPPTISNINPDRGVSGTNVIISGQNFQNVQEVKFGSQTVGVKSSTSTIIQVDAPAYGSVQTVQVTVRTNAGTSNAAQFTGAPQADINQTPTPNGLISGGPLTLRGSYFSNVTGVDFMNSNGDVTATVSSQSFLPSDPGSLILKVPIGVSAGFIRVNNEYGKGKPRSIGKLSGNDAITTGNVATNIGSLITNTISDECGPESFFYCISDRPIVLGFKRYSVKCNKIYYGTEILGNTTYETYAAYNYTSTNGVLVSGFTLKLGRNSQNNGYSGTAIVAVDDANKQTIYYVGSVLQNGDIYAYSLSTGALLRMCKRNFFDIPGQTNTCTDCK